MGFLVFIQIELQQILGVSCPCAVVLVLLVLLVVEMTTTCEFSFVFSV